MRLSTFTFHKFQEKTWTLNRDSNSDLQISSLALYHWALLVHIPIHLQTLLLKCHFYKAVWSMTLPVIYWSLSELTSLLNKYNALNQIIKYLNQIISENKPYNLRLCAFTFYKFFSKYSSHKVLLIIHKKKWKQTLWTLK